MSIQVWFYRHLAKLSCFHSLRHIVLRRMLKNDRYDVRSEAVEIIKKLRCPGRVFSNTLFRMLKNKNPELREFAADSVTDVYSWSERGDIEPRMIDMLVQVAIHDSNDRVSIYAWNELGLIWPKPDSALQLLLKSVQHDDARIRARAVRVLERFEPLDVVQCLLQLAKDESGDVRAQVFRVLNRVLVQTSIRRDENSMRSVFECAAKALDDDEQAVRVEAAEALRLSGDPARTVSLLSERIARGAYIVETLDNFSWQPQTKVERFWYTFWHGDHKGALALDQA